ncbi:protein kinase family protein [Lederbergia wuyishanensis]|uniref:Ser/Thr protein kinase n=1 Tax=Lederbergia wuyishanensis TaxID=1347903 RepID=A0ABU0D6W6_9BACI|nr:protein kinase family protein [Lederbergia wuyishanensis]MCJ8008806.1 protein kinase family protein [Lederbergia wuyishanensis]MDQ0344127.1 putative Ser/Thr protein kinase [Lederbergia wuyishanensis]
MNKYSGLANSVVINPKNHKLIHYDASLTLIGAGRSAYVFKINNTNQALKIFFPSHQYLANVEADVYKSIQHINYFPKFYESGIGYLVIDYIEGYTLFECLTRGIPISENNIKEVDMAIQLARKEGLNPSDIHLRNIIIHNGKIKMIDVARFKQVETDKQWIDLKNAFYHLYTKSFFPKKIPAFILNGIAVLYKRFNRKSAIQVN